MDKVAAKHELREAGIPTPDWVAFNATAFRELGAADTLEEIEERLGFPLVVKPASQGSSLGVKFAAEPRARSPRRWSPPSATTTGSCSSATSTGRELAVGVLGDEPLPIVEAIPRDGDRFDFEARYEIGRTEYVCPAELARRRRRARSPRRRPRAYEALGCSGFARVDLILGDDGPQVLEVNAIPGLTDTSLFPMAAEAAGLSFEQLVERIVALALERPRERGDPAGLALSRRGLASSPPAAKSSGETLSRNSLNLSTTSSVSSTSCSNSIADSSITSSAAKIGAEQRTARASASEGRESISISEPFIEIVIEA